jgi:hypothetical protein
MKSLTFNSEGSARTASTAHCVQRGAASLDGFPLMEELRRWAELRLLPLPHAF